MKKKLLIGSVVMIMLLTLLGTTACDSMGGSQGGVSQQTVEVTRGDIIVGLSGNGKIETSREARLTFGSGGKVDEILVDEGEEVMAGDVLARLDTSTLDLAYTQAQLAVTQAEVALTQAKLAFKTAEYNLKNTRDTEDALKLVLLNAQIAYDVAEDNMVTVVKSYHWDSFQTIESELNKARTFYDYAVLGSKEATGNDASANWVLTLERAEDWLEAAQADYDNFIAGHRNADVILSEKRVESAELAVAQAQKNIDDLGEDIELQELQVASAEQAVTQAEQSVALARKSLADSQRQLDEATIFAPFDGVVAMLLAEEDDIVPSPSMAPQPIVQLINVNYLELVVEVDEIDIPLVSLGQKADITLDALPDDTFKGTVTAIYPVPMEVGGVVLYKVKVALDVPENSGIKIGMTASADIVAEKHENVLLVPSRAVVRNDQGQMIVRVKKGEEIVEREVVVGLDDGLRAEIISGVQEGETVMYEVKVKAPSTSFF